ncbi:MAG: ATP-binding cassette domain-containing protein [Armatimonadetes bacterium]|nr:ATP-binding cassette domain-containing protein [Armatimonadota bacterium]
MELKNVEVVYNRDVCALRDVNLQIARGEFVFLVGKTGAGKSTILKLLSREANVTTGDVLLEGNSISRIPRNKVHLHRRRLGIVPQDFALLPKKNIWENVGYAMRAVGATKREIRARAPEILDLVGIAHRADAFPNQLSGGEQQRVAIARALINDPPILLADEPTGNLDPEFSIEIMEVLERINQRGATVIVATHDMPVVERMRKRVVTMEKGRVISDVVPEPIVLETAVVDA